MTPQDPIFKELASGLCHRTSVMGYRGILADRCIKPNKDGLFPSTYAQSRESCCRKLEAISLFDFETTPHNKIFDPLIQVNWGRFIYDLRPVTIILKIKREAVADRIINSDEAGHRDDGGVIIKPVEVCYPGFIPIGAVCGCIVTYPLGNNRYKFRKINNLPSMRDIKNLNEEFRKPILTGEERYEAYDYGEYCVVNFKFDSSARRIVMRLSSISNGQREILISFEGVKNLNIIEQLHLEPGYVELLSRIEHTSVIDNDKFYQESGYSREYLYTINTDIRTIEFQSQEMESKDI
ncbi:hypothetical protein [Rhodocaloribacter sp.]